tara:strand:- start:911 stop:1408 length:498 start_codon:yes stop_codon:yes gene_type:complete
MAGFHTKTFLKHDDYMTPQSAWINIKNFIPTDKVIWEAFYGDGASGDYLKELGFDVIHQEEDFFENNRGDIVVSNPPFSKKKEVLTRLKELDKPFILILPASTLTTKYIRELFRGHIQIIIPRKRIHFDKKVDGKTPENWRNACNFDCFYYCYKMNLDNDITFLD